MSRNYANMSTSRWRPESGYGNLSRDAQWAHYLLNTQSDISAAGVLSLNVKRWASRAVNTTQAEVIAALQELQAAGWALYDTQTEELLVRGFIRDDGGYNNQKRRHVIERAVRDVESMTLRRALLAELVELGLPAEWVGISGAVGEPEHNGPEAPARSVLDVPAQRTPEDAFPQVDRLYRETDIAYPENLDTPSRSDGVVVTQAVVVRPQPSTHIPQPVPPSAAPAVPADAETAVGLFNAPPPPIDPDAEEKEARNRAFGLARWWIDQRKAQNTPVIAGGKGGPLHPLQSMIKQFTAAYTDDEIRQALANLDQGFPSKSAMDKALAHLRKSQQRQLAYQPDYEPRGTVVLADRHGPPRESAQLRKARDYAAMGAALDAELLNGGLR